MQGTISGFTPFDEPQAPPPPAVVTGYVTLPFYESLRACTACSARQEALQVVGGTGPVDARMLVIGQNPGEDEDRAGIPFIGNAGDEFNAWLALLGLDRQKLVVTNVVKCFPGETLVESVGVERSYRREYVGDLVRVTTVDGELTGTPNHPVLTGRGWVPLGQLQPGGDLVRGSYAERMRLRNPDIKRRPAKIAELFYTLSKFGVTERVAGTDVDFHGERPQSEVEIVSGHRLLWDRLEPELFQHPLQQVFVPADYGTRDLLAQSPRRREFMTMFGALLSSSRGVVSSCSEMRAAVGVQDLPTIPKGSRVASNSNASGNERLFEFGLADAQLVRQGEETAPAAVGLAQILRVERFAWRGRVYSLQTSSDEYIANGFIVHNCHTTKNRVPRTSEIKTCADLWLSEELIHLPDVTVLMPLGKPAVTAVLGKSAPPMTPIAVHHYVVRTLGRELRVFPLPHPAFLLRARHLQPMFRETILGQLKLTLRQEVPEAYRWTAAGTVV